MPDQNITPDSASEIMQDFLLSPEALENTAQKLIKLASVLEMEHSRKTCEMVKRTRLMVTKTKMCAAAPIMSMLLAAVPTE